MCFATDKDGTGFIIFDQVRPVSNLLYFFRTNFVFERDLRATDKRDVSN